MWTLLLETSTERSLLALFQDGQLLHEELFASGSKLSETLVATLDCALRRYALSFQDCSWIAVGIGPGSYTGTRVGVSIAQALAYAQRIPLVTLCSLHGFIPQQEGRFASLIDAKMGGVYVAIGTCQQGFATFHGPPCLEQLESLAPHLQEVEFLITPCLGTMKARCQSHVPASALWIERHPDSRYLYCLATSLYEAGESYLDKPIPILYMRKTQAEIERESRPSPRF